MLAIWIRREMKWLVANREMIVWVAMHGGWNDYDQRVLSKLQGEQVPKIVQTT